MTLTPTLFGMEQQERTSDDYYTPAWVFERLGLHFDLDVCAPPGGVPWVPADRYFSMADDGLAQEWHGRVWMNPPYSNVTPWWERFAQHGNGVALLPTAKSLWLNQVWNEAEAVLVAPDARGQAGEMFFVRPGEPKPLRIWFPVLFAAFGDECVDALGNLGTVRVAK